MQESFRKSSRESSTHLTSVQTFREISTDEFGWSFDRQIARKPKVPSMPELFKYRVWNSYSKPIIERGELFFAPPSWFNDPFEFRPYLDHLSSPDELHAFIEDGLNLLIKDLAKHVSPEEAARLKELLKQSPPDHIQSAIKNLVPKIAADPELQRELTARFSHFREESLERFGVCCLSSNYKSILMWSHYAKDHTGFCIGFDPSLDPTLKESIQVRYTESLPKIPAFRLDDSRLLQLIINDLVFTKADVWSYEDEWRCVVDAEDGGRVRQIEMSAITRIVFGAKISQNDKTEISELVDRYLPIAKEVL